MDSDPFAVWDDPTPSASTSTSKGTRASPAKAAKEEARLSLEYEDEDPGWGAPSRSNSPEKSRKAAPAMASTKVEEEEAAEQQSTNEAAGGSDTIAAEESTAAQQANEAEAQSASRDIKDGTQDIETEMEDDEAIDTFEDSKQDQADHPEEDGISSEEFTNKATIGELVQKEADAGDEAFDDYGEPSAAATATHDDFGDFDDFETGDAPNDADFGDDGFGDDDTFDQPGNGSQAPAATAVPTPAPASTRTWTSLNVTPSSKRLELSDSVTALLPLSTAAEAELTNAPLRQVEGPSQVLVSSGSRQLFTDLTSMPSVRPIDWVRSRTRRDYLISMGVPVNLDEIHSTFSSGSNSRQLPPLQLKYDSNAKRASGSSSHDSNPSLLQRSSSLKIAGNGPSSSGSGQARSASTSNSPRNGNASPALGSSANRERIAERRMQELGLGPAPQVDLKRAEDLVGKTEDQLTLLSLPALKSMLRELNSLTTSTSSLLTHHLTLRESYQADSEMYNAMIKELVTGAANRIGSGAGGGSTGSGGRGDMRRSNTMMATGSAGGNKGPGGRVTSMPPGAAGIGGGVRSGSPSLSLRGGAGSSPRR